jgi:hypothetical protein
LAQDFAILQGRVGAQADLDAGALTVWEKLTFTDERLTLAFKSQLQLEEVLQEMLRKLAIGAEAFTTANQAQQDASYSRSKVVDLTDHMDQLEGCVIRSLEPAP